MNFSISDGLKYSCLGNSSPAKRRTNAENNFEQVGCYPQKGKDRFYNKFLVKRTAQENETICFEIGSVISTSKNSEMKFYKPFDELEINYQKKWTTW